MSSEQAIGPGQWIGELSGVNVPSGWLTISIEADRPEAGFACMQQGDPVPPWRVRVTWKKDGSKIIGKSFGQALVFDDKVKSLVPRENHSNRDSFNLPDTIRFIATADGPTISGDWIAQPGTHGTFRVENTLGVETTATKMSWSEVKDEIAKHSNKVQGDFWFRGQPSNKLRLTTSFHRQRRYDLLRYDQEALQLLCREIESLLCRRIELSDPVEYGAFLSLAQHHGFPTPLLDWTASPYVAAYFALSGEAREDDARLFAFNFAQWAKLPQPRSIANPLPAVSAHEFKYDHNPRHLPQQSRHTFSNVADIGGFMQIVGEQRAFKYLKAIDIPVGEWATALKDLRAMGITKESLFPNIDETCKTLKERLFGCL